MVDGCLSFVMPYWPAVVVLVEGGHQEINLILHSHKWAGYPGSTELGLHLDFTSASAHPQKVLMPPVMH